MQNKRARLGLEMTLLPSLESLVPEDYPLRRLDSVLDLDFVHEAVADKYCQDNGRPSIDPEVLVRLFLLQAVHRIKSVRQLMREVQVNLAYRWFIGYRVDEKLPDHSTLSRALDRFGDELFNQLFERSVKDCQASGLIEGKVLHLDATTIRADLDRTRVNKSDSPDKDARFGRFPDGKIKPGYKQHSLADGQKRVVVSVAVTPANSPDDSTMNEMIDDVSDRLGSSPEAVCADAAYGSGSNAADMESRGIRFVSPPYKSTPHTGDKYFNIEDFEYNESLDKFTCPAGQQLKYVQTEKRRGRRIYRARRSHCGVCHLRSQCTKSEQRSLNVTRYHGSLVRLRADSKTDSFKQLYRQRSPVIEGVFAEAKQWHGLGRAWRRGLTKMRMQCFLIAAVMNYKRLGAVLANLLGIESLFALVVDAIRDTLQTSVQHCSPILPNPATNRSTA